MEDEDMNVDKWKTNRYYGTEEKL